MLPLPQTYATIAKARGCFLALIGILIFLSAAKTHATQTQTKMIRYPRAGENFIEHHAYPIALLSLALEKSQQNVHLTPSENFMHQGRALKQLEAGQDIEALWTMTSKAREQALIPIRIPIYKGLIGWRVFLSSRKDILNASNAISLEQVKSLSTIQGHDWPDTHILKHNGFNIQSSPSYAGLFTMLALQRADLFPRSIIEVWDELRKFEADGVGLEQRTLISYPSASYFFVSPNNKALAMQIENGLRKAIRDGSFENLFQQHFANAIEKAKPLSRTHYRLENPLLPEMTPTHDKALWFMPNLH